MGQNGNYSVTQLLNSLLNDHASTRGRIDKTDKYKKDTRFSYKKPISRRSTKSFLTFGHILVLKVS